MYTSDQIIAIVTIQTVYRAIKRVEQLKKDIYQAKNVLEGPELVQELRVQLGEFAYDDTSMDSKLGVRERREKVTLENKCTY